jgi:hypothetical protein
MNSIPKGHALAPQTTLAVVYDGRILILPPLSTPFWAQRLRRFSVASHKIDRLINLLATLKRPEGRAPGQCKDAAVYDTKRH